MNDQSFHSTVYQAQIIRVFIVSPWIEVKISAHWIIIIQGIWLKKNTLDLWVRYLHVRAIWMHIYICLRINAYWCDCGACHTYNEQNKNSWKAQLARIGTPTTRLTYRPLTPRPYVRAGTHTHIRKQQKYDLWEIRETYLVTMCIPIVHTSHAHSYLSQRGKPTRAVQAFSRTPTFNSNKNNKEKKNPWSHEF